MFHHSVSYLLNFPFYPFSSCTFIFLLGRHLPFAFAFHFIFLHDLFSSLFIYCNRSFLFVLFFMQLPFFLYLSHARSPHLFALCERQTDTEFSKEERISSTQREQCVNVNISQFPLQNFH